MAHHTELELKTFELSSIYSDLTLSITSVALVSDVPSEYPPDELCRLIQESQLWLVSSGLCRIQIIVDQSRLPMSSEEARISFLEHLADTICECPVSWHCWFPSQLLIGLYLALGYSRPHNQARGRPASVTLV